MTKQSAIDLLRKVITEFSTDQKSTLRHNIAQDCSVLCGERAYMFCDTNGGCLLTLATVRDFPTDKYDFKRIEEICVEMAPVYNQTVKRYGLDYYHSTQVVDCHTLQDLILECCS